MSHITYLATCGDVELSSSRYMELLKLVDKNEIPNFRFVCVVRTRADAPKEVVECEEIEQQDVISDVPAQLTVDGRPARKRVNSNKMAALMAMVA